MDPSSDGGNSEDDAGIFPAYEDDNDFATPDEDAWIEEDDELEDDEGESVYSLAETEDQQKGWLALVDNTKDLFFSTSAVYHELPTSLEHFQSADGISCFNGSNSELIVIASEVLNLQMHSIPQAGRISQYGSNEHRLLGGFDQQIFEAYSISPSMSSTEPAKGYVAVSGDHGCVAFYTLQTDAALPNGPGFAPAQNEAIFSTSAITITHSNMGMDGLPPPIELVKVMEWQDAGGWKGNNFKNRVAKFEQLYTKDQRHMDEQWGNWAWAHHAPRSLWEAYRESLARCNQLSGIEALRPQYWQQLVDGKPRNGVLPSVAAVEKVFQDALKMYDKAHPEEKRPETPMTPPILLNSVVSLGFNDEGDAAQMGIDPEMMANGVRHGLVEGKQRMLVANQDGYVYIFEDMQAPSGSNAHSVDPASRMCSGLNSAGNEQWKLRPVNIYSTERVFLGVGLNVRPTVHYTAAIGSFGVPTNFAIPSPDGRWIAVVVDADYLVLVDQTNKFSWTTIAMEAPRPAQPNMEIEFIPNQDLHGGQYCAWNSDSTLVAASSDAMHAVFVFDPNASTCLMKVTNHVMPCLSIMFAPWDPTLLIYTEHSKHIHIRKVLRSSDGTTIERNAMEDMVSNNVDGTMQLLRFPRCNGEVIDAIDDFSGQRRRINGAVLTPDGDLLVASNQNLVFRYLGLHQWSVEKHKMWPPACKDAIKAVLMCYHKGSSRDNNAEPCIWDIPESILLKIIKLAAGNRSEWMHPGLPYKAAGDWKL